MSSGRNVSTNAWPVLTVQLSSTTGGGFGAVTGAATARAVCGGVDRVAATDTVSNRSRYLANPERRRQATASNQRRYARSARTRPTLGLLEDLRWHWPPRRHVTGSRTGPSPPAHPTPRHVCGALSRRPVPKRRWRAPTPDGARVDPGSTRAHRSHATQTAADGRHGRTPSTRAATQRPRPDAGGTVQAVQSQIGPGEGYQGPRRPVLQVANVD